MTEWFNPKYGNTPFGEKYTEEFNLPEERNIQEVNSIEKIIKKYFPLKPKVLDLAGGFGRIGKPLQDRLLVSNLLVDFDLNLKFLRMAQQSRIQNVVQGDMRKLPFTAESFDLILLMFTSFGYFPTQEEDKQVLHETYRTLTRDGQFLMDLPNFHRITQYFLPARELKLANGGTIKYTKKIEEGVLIEERIITNSQRESTTLAPLKLRIYLKEDIQAICNKTGFKKIELTDENLNYFNPKFSKRMWVRCKK